MALVLPVFLTFVLGLIEFGHAFMVTNLLTSAAKTAARAAIGGTVTNTDVTNRVKSILDSAIKTSQVAVLIKDGSVYDAGTTGIDVASLPDIDLANTDPKQLFVVRVEVDYDDICLMPPIWTTGIRLSGQSIMRHE